MPVDTLAIAEVEVEATEPPLGPDGDARFFKRLSNCTGLDGLADLEDASGKAPPTLVRLRAALHEEDFPVPKHDGPDGRHGPLRKFVRRGHGQTTKRTRTINPAPLRRRGDRNRRRSAGARRNSRLR